MSIALIRLIAASPTPGRIMTYCVNRIANSRKAARWGAEARTRSSIMSTNYAQPGGDRSAERLHSRSRNRSRPEHIHSEGDSVTVENEHNSINLASDSTRHAREQPGDHDMR